MLWVHPKLNFTQHSNIYCWNIHIGFLLCSLPCCLSCCQVWPRTAQQPQLQPPGTGQPCRKWHGKETSVSRQGRQRWRQGWCGHHWCGQSTGWGWQLLAQSTGPHGGHDEAQWSSAGQHPCRKRQRTWSRRTLRRPPAKNSWTGTPTWWLFTWGSPPDEDSLKINRGWVWKR